MSDPIIEAALTERIRMCVASGLCICNGATINPNCPCHTVAEVALTGSEAVVAQEIIDSQKANEQETASPT